MGSTPTSTATPAWAKPIAALTWVGVLISCILWTWRWTLPSGTSVDVLSPTGLCGGTRIAAELLTYETVYCLVRGTGACPLRRWRWTLQTKILPRHTADMQFSFNLYPCWTTHHLMKIYATLPYIVITLKFKILFLWNLKILQFQNLIVSLKGLYFIKNWVLKRSLFLIFLSLYCIGNHAQLLRNVCTEPVLVWCRGFL